MELIRGINFGPFARRGSFEGAAARESLTEMKRRTAATHVIFTPAGIQAAPQSETIDFSGPGTLSDKELSGMIAFAQGLGLRVILKPTVNCANGVWRAYVDFFDEEIPREPGWGRWFSSHEAFQLHYAALARKTGCELFIAGCEMVLSERREQEWKNLIRKIKLEFSGPVSYNTDKYREDHVRWWDCVDVISSSGYYPLGTWEAELDRIEAVVRRYGKPFFFAEAGCPSVAGGAAVPNDWSLGGPADPGEQERWYRDLFGHAGRRPWVGGYGLWSWPAALPGDDREGRGYSLYGKPAEAVVRSVYSR